MTTKHVTVTNEKWFCLKVARNSFLVCVAQAAEHCHWITANAWNNRTFNHFKWNTLHVFARVHQARTCPNSDLVPSKFLENLDFDGTVVEYGRKFLFLSKENSVRSKQNEWEKLYNLKFLWNILQNFLKTGILIVFNVQNIHHKNIMEGFSDFFKR